MPPARLAAALLVRALGLFPRGYRREYGEERAWVLRMAIEQRAAAGWGPLVRFVGREVRDLPLALVREHWKAWRQEMNRPQQSGLLSTETMSRGQRLWFAFPFLVVLILPLSRLSGLWVPEVMLLFALTIGVIVVGVGKGLPGWSLPGLGLAFGFAELLIFPHLAYGVVAPIQLKSILWTNFMPSRVLYALILASLMIAPAVVLLLLLPGMAKSLPERFTLKERLARDWTLLPFVLYSANLLTPFGYDPYQGLEPTQLLFLLPLIGGAWLYMRATRPAVRLAIMLAATLLSGIVLALGIYLIFPNQQFGGGFPRWWESLQPLLAALVRMVALVVVAAGAAAVGRREGSLAV